MSWITCPYNLKLTHAGNSGPIPFLGTKTGIPTLSNVGPRNRGIEEHWPAFPLVSSMGYPHGLVEKIPGWKGLSEPCLLGQARPFLSGIWPLSSCQYAPAVPALTSPPHGFFHSEKKL